LCEKALTRRQSYHHFVKKSRDTLEKIMESKALDNNIGPLGFRKRVYNSIIATEEYR